MVYLSIITNKKELHNLKELIEPVYNHFDGLLVVYDAVQAPEKDECFQYLETRKGAGQILFRKWTNDHDLQMNVFLREGPLKDGDWFVIRDSSERFNPEWSKDIKTFLNSMSMAGIRSIYNYGKGFAFQWNDSMIFQGSPHWGLVGAEHNAIDLRQYHNEDNKEWTWRVKNGTDPLGRPANHKIDHEAKYCWVYGRSNHTLLNNEDNIDAYKRAEYIRQAIRKYAKINGFSTENLQGLTDFIKFYKEQDYDNFVIFINSHRTWKNYYRQHFLNHSIEEVESNEEDWMLS